VAQQATNDTARRPGEVLGFSAKYRCDRVVYAEHSTARNAIAREKQLEGWPQAKKIALIEEQSPKIDVA
jgi:predicted GIY-YIG superfamily endonuclease